MKKGVWLVSLLFSLATFAQNATKDAYSISGSLTDVSDGTIVMLYHPGVQGTLAMDTVKAKKFKLNGTVPYEGLGKIVFVRDKLNKPIDLFFGANKIKISGSLQTPKSTIITGSPTQQVFVNFLKIFEPDFKTLNALNAKSNAITDAAERQKMQEQFQAKVDNIEKNLETFVTKNNTSVVSAFALYVTKDLFATNPQTVKDKMDAISGDAALTSVYYDALHKDIESKLFGSVGSTATDFTQADTAGKLVTLSSFKGKYVLLDFWASWCGPCRMENPNVVAAYNKFKQKNFTVLGVSLDRPGKKEDWVKAIAEDNLMWTNVSDLKFWQNEVAQLYKVGSIPQNYLIGPDGKIVGKNLRGEALEQKLCELLGCN